MLKDLLCGITGCARPHMIFCRFTAAERNCEMEQLRERLQVVLSCVITEGFLIYGVLSVTTRENWPATDVYWRLFLYALYLLTLLKVLLQKHNAAEMILLAGCAALAELSRITTQTSAVLWFLAGFVIAKDLNLQKILKIDLVTRVVLGVCLIVLPLVGLYPNQAGKLIGERLRDSFGWAHPNEMGLFFLMLCVLWIYFRHKSWNRWDTCGIVLLILFLDRFPNSRTSEICMVGILLMEGIAYLLRRKETEAARKAAFWGVGGGMALVGGLAVAGFLTYFGDRAWLSALPATFHARAALAHDTLELNGVSFLGQMVDVYYLDMMYAYLGLQMGVLVLLLFLFVNALALWYAWKQRDERMQIILIVYLTYSVLEHEHFKMLSGFYPILLGCAFWAAFKHFSNTLKKNTAK